MKYLLIAVLFFTVTVSAAERCTKIGTHAETAMMHRQYVNDIADIMKIMKDFDFTKDDDKYVLDVVVSAYAVPFYNSKKLKNNAIRDFKNKTLAKCLKESRS